MCQTVFRSEGRDRLGTRLHTYRHHILHRIISIFHTCINRSAGANIYGMRYAHTNIINNLLRIERPCCTIICRASCSAMRRKIINMQVFTPQLASEACQLGCPKIVLHVYII